MRSDFSNENNEKRKQTSPEENERKTTKKIENLNLADNIKYSTVDIYIKEPK